MAPRPPADAEQSTRRRILAATFVVLARDGRRKLQLSDVAAEAKVSRPTLYRHFGSKEGLLEAFGLYEQDNFDAGIAAAIAGLSGPDRLDAALQFIVDFQSTYSLGSLADTEPEHVIYQMRRSLPIMHERIARIIPGDGQRHRGRSSGANRRMPLHDRSRQSRGVPRRTAPRRRPRPVPAAPATGRLPANRASRGFSPRSLRAAPGAGNALPRR